MKNFLITTILLLSLFVSVTSCTAEDRIGEPATGLPGASDGSDNGNGDTNSDAAGDTITVRIGDAVFTAALSGNESASAFRAMLPLTVRMAEHAGNEKYYNLPARLPSAPYRTRNIRAGDLMLWGDDCVVLFYETFSSGYSYTNLGRITGPAGLSAAVGAGDVTVTFE